MDYSFTQEFGLILVGAIVFIASFLWKDFFSDIQEKFFPKTEGLTDRFIFIVIVTVGLVIFAVSLRRLFGLSGTSPLTISYDEPQNDSDNGS